MPHIHDTGIYMTTPLHDSGINDRLVKLRTLIDQSCWVYWRQIFWIGKRQNSKEYLSNI